MKKKKKLQMILKNKKLKKIIEIFEIINFF